MVTLITSTIQTSYAFTKYIQIRNTVDAAPSSIAMKNGLSTMNIGVISKNAINVVAGTCALLWETRQPSSNSSDIER